MIPKGALALQVETAGVRLLRCQPCGERLTFEAAPTELPAEAGVVVPAPTLPLDGIHVHKHQGFVTAGELARRAQRRAHALAVREARPAATVRSREPGEDD